MPIFERDYISVWKALGIHQCGTFDPLPINPVRLLSLWNYVRPHYYLGQSNTAVRVIFPVLCRRSAKIWLLKTVIMICLVNSFPDFLQSINYTLAIYLHKLVIHWKGLLMWCLSSILQSSTYLKNWINKTSEFRYMLGFVIFTLLEFLFNLSFEGPWCRSNQVGKLDQRMLSS